ncbi:hypothetical protein J7M28_12840 [bacterium]|nr:hypothetical protein [bacterium]
MTRVIGAREVERLEIGASLTIPLDAIITPLAKDIIGEKRLKLIMAEAEAEVAAAERETEENAAEAALEESLHSSQVHLETTRMTEQSNIAEPQTASVVEATVKHLLARDLLKKVDCPDAEKFAVFGADAAALLRAVVMESEMCEARIERLSGRVVAGLFVLAVAVSFSESGEQRPRKALEEGLSRRGVALVLGTQDGD